MRRCVEKVRTGVRERAAKALGRPGRTEEAISILLTLAQMEKDIQARQSAA